jgi:hypothetical protein
LLLTIVCLYLSLHHNQSKLHCNTGASFFWKDMCLQPFYRYGLYGSTAEASAVTPSVLRILDPQCAEDGPWAGEVCRCTVPVLDECIALCDRHIGSYHQSTQAVALSCTAPWCSYNWINSAAPIIADSHAHSHRHSPWPQVSERTLPRARASVLCISILQRLYNTSTWPLLTDAHSVVVPALHSAALGVRLHTDFARCPDRFHSSNVVVHRTQLFALYELSR